MFSPVVHADVQRTPAMSGTRARMDCRVKPGNDDVENHSRDILCPSLSHHA
jgi:hypothetical protein